MRDPSLVLPIHWISTDVLSQVRAKHNWSVGYARNSRFRIDSMHGSPCSSRSSSALLGDQQAVDELADELALVIDGSRCDD